MLKYNFIYEFKHLIRSRWIQVLSVLLLSLFAFAVYNGQQKVEKRNSDIQLAVEEMEANDTRMLQLLDSVSQGLQVSAPRWTVPSSPMAVGNYYPRVAAMEGSPMAFTATGQSDLFTHFVKPTVSGDDVAMNFTEMTSPVQLLFGSFDLAFVIVYLLPLLVIAFSYDVLSKEKENGTLKLLASQPIRLSQWVFQKLGLRSFCFMVLTIVFLVLSIVIFGDVQGMSFSGFSSLLMVILAYTLFWFALAFLINILGYSSAKNAVLMVSLWGVFVLLIPSVLGQLGDSLYPMPSRTVMINEIRELKTEVAKKQDEILDNYLRDHPEYAINDPSQSRSFYHRYMASQNLIKTKLEPLVATYDEQHIKQLSFLGRLKWLSPAVLTQESLNKLAGTSAWDYEHYKSQVLEFANTWRGHLVPFLYNNQNFTRADYAALPHFEFKPKAHEVSLGIFVLMGIAIIIIALGLRAQSVKTLNM